jgi:hypothetical protein
MRKPKTPAIVLLSIAVLIASPPSQSQGLTREKMPAALKRSVENESLVWRAGGMRLEVLGNRRIDIEHLASGEQAVVVTRDSTNTALSPSSPALIFNHGYGQYGFITGEIAFKFRHPESVAGFPKQEFGGLARVGSLDVYTVQSNSPSQFILYMRKLSARQDVLWIEPFVEYVAEVRDVTARD